MNWVLLAVLYPLLTGLLNVVEKLLRANYIRSSLAMTLFWGISPLLLLPFVPLLHIGVLPFSSLIAALAVGALALFAALPFYYALSFEEVSRVAPLWQLSSIFVLFGAVFLLGETLRAAQYAAFVFIFVGGFLLATKRTNTSFRITPAVSFIVLGGMVSAVALLLLKFGVRSPDAVSVTFWIYAGNSIAAALLLLRRSVRADVAAAMKTVTFGVAALMLVALVLGLAGTLALVLALQEGPATMVSIISNMKGLFVLLYSTLLSFWFPSLLNENTKRYVFYKKLAAITLMLVGMALLQF